MNTALRPVMAQDSKRQTFSLGDVLVFLLIALVIHSVIASAARWTADLNPNAPISHNLSSLPLYASYSFFRAMAAYGLSLAFTLILGYAAAKSRTAERITLPLLDIGQSIPVLGFLPGLVLGLLALFPRSNFGLELACVIMIFTGQVWNMTFSFYASLKGIPSSFIELSRVIGLSPLRRLLKVELPFAAYPLAWNSLMSMAGGWFFLTVCESFTLSGQNFRLPGLGSFMAQAIEHGDHRAMLGGFLAMVTLIVGLDFFFWRPLVAWTRRFRLEEQEAPFATAALGTSLYGESRLVEMFFRARAFFPKHLHPFHRATRTRIHLGERRFFQVIRTNVMRLKKSRVWRPIFILALTSGALGALWRVSDLLHHIQTLTRQDARAIALGTGATLLRVLTALTVSTLWTVPCGIWIGLSQARTRLFQPIVQVCASFPAPMLYPLALALFSFFKIGFGVGAGMLMMLGAQWYVLFNVLAGAATISQELRDAFELARASRWLTWTRLYVPSIFPSLVTGWISAAGGAWNASIIAESLDYKGQTFKTVGLGALINQATATGNFPLLAGSLGVMIIVVVTFNRTVWQRLYVLVRSRYRFES